MSITTSRTTGLAVSRDRIDWQQTHLGPRNGWPPGLAGIVDLVLASPVAMAFAYGPDLILVYNDAYAAILGDRHPTAFGRPATAQADSDAPTGIDAAAARVLRTGEPYVSPEALFAIRRGANGPVQEAWLIRSHSPVRNDAGDVIGVLTVVVETTEATGRLVGLSDLAAELAIAVNLDDIARVALRFAIQRIGADHARFSLREGRGIRVARRAKADYLDDAEERLPPLWSHIPEDVELPTVRATRDGGAIWVETGATERYEGLSGEPGGASRIDSLACLPLRGRGLFGAYAVGWESAQRFPAQRRAFFGAAAELIGQAAARARQYEEQQGLAELLQRSMLPAELPTVPGVALAARYLPAIVGTSVGGDFYDVINVAGRELVLVIGDVVGRGAAAASVMGQVRAALHALALHEPDPVSILDGLDPFVAELGEEAFVTALCVALNPATGAARAASAGHLPPLSSGRTGGREWISYLPVPAGPPLGTHGTRPVFRYTMVPGEQLLLFTDGLVENRHRPIDEGMRDLLTLAGTMLDADPRQLCAAVLADPPSGTAGEDDIAVLAVCRTVGPNFTASVELPLTAQTPRRARRFLRDRLRSWSAPPSIEDDAVLALDELVSNALLHGRSGVRIEVDRDERRLLVLVADRGVHGEVQAVRDDPVTGRGRGLVLVEALSAAWGSERTARGTTVWFEMPLV